MPVPESLQVYRIIYKDKMVKKTMQNKKRGQVTIFIILAILIVGGVLTYIFYLQPTYLSPNTANLKIESCINGIFEEPIKDLAKNGGMIEPTFAYQYNGENISYLCYTNDYYQTCTVQNPFPEKLFEKNLAEITKDEISSCYSSSLDDLRKKGYDVPEEVPAFNIELQPEKIITTFEGGVTITKESSQTIGELKIETKTSVYNLLMLATTILQQEVQFGDSDTSSLMESYQEYSIDKLKQGDGTTVYIITDKQNKLKYQFASKSLPWPPGYGIKK